MHRFFAATLLAVEQDGAAYLPEHPLKSMAVQQILRFFICAASRGHSGLRHGQSA